MAPLVLRPVRSCASNLTRCVRRSRRSGISRARSMQRRRTVLAGTPVSLPTLPGRLCGRAVGPVAAATRNEGMQSLLDLATLLETKGASATYVGDGDLRRGAGPGAGRDRERSWTALDPDDHGEPGRADHDARSCSGATPATRHRPGRSSRSSAAPDWLDVFDVLSRSSPPAADASPDAGARSGGLALTPTQQLAVTLLQSGNDRQPGRHPGLRSRDLANRTQISRGAASALESTSSRSSPSRAVDAYDPYGSGSYTRAGRGQEVREKLAALDAVERCSTSADGSCSCWTPTAANSCTRPSRSATWTPPTTCPSSPRASPPPCRTAWRASTADMAGPEGAGRTALVPARRRRTPWPRCPGWGTTRPSGTASPSRRGASPATTWPRTGGEDLAGFYAGHQRLPQRTIRT